MFVSENYTWGFVDLVIFVRPTYLIVKINLLCQISAVSTLHF